MKCGKNAEIHRFSQHVHPWPSHIAAKCISSPQQREHLANASGFATDAAQGSFTPCSQRAGTSSTIHCPGTDTCVAIRHKQRYDCAGEDLRIFGTADQKRGKWSQGRTPEVVRHQKQSTTELEFRPKLHWQIAFHLQISCFQSRWTLYYAATWRRSKLPM